MTEDYVETTFVALKPDAVKRGIVGEIISIIEDTGLKISGMKMVQATDQL
ncbi:MAG: nucleoside-diphosphate kinase, partial [Candidatus Nanohaloarchaea archaeon]